MGGWLCDRCHKAQATFHVLNIEPSGEKVQRHLCERCAAEEGEQTVEKAAPTDELIEKLVLSAKGKTQSLHSLVCDQCGTSYVEFRNQGLLGCPNDYDAFKEILSHLIERAHDGATHHTGKTPRTLGVSRTTQQDVQRLRRLLDDAVAAEDYERAAELRDRIREAERK